jgi:hypothetical protein
MKCAQTLEVGAYVLGALSPGERDAFEKHLGECAICREEVAELAVLPGLLGRIDAATAMAVARDGEEHSILPSSLLADADDGPSAWAGPTAAAAWAGPTAGTDGASADEPGPGKWAGPTAVPDTVPETTAEASESAEASGSNVVSLLDAAARRRAKEQRRRRFGTFAVAAAAACLALAVGLGLPPLLRGDDGTKTPTGPVLTAMSQVAPSVPVIAEIAMKATTSGTRVTMHCTYTRSTSQRWPFQLVAVPVAGGAPEVLHNWSATYGDDILVSVDSGLQPDQIDKIEIRNMAGDILLSFTP